MQSLTASHGMLVQASAASSAGSLKFRPVEAARVVERLAALLGHRLLVGAERDRFLVGPAVGGGAARARAEHVAAAKDRRAVGLRKAALDVVGDVDAELRHGRGVGVHAIVGARRDARGGVAGVRARADGAAKLLRIGAVGLVGGAGGGVDGEGHGEEEDQGLHALPIGTPRGRLREFVRPLS